MANNTVFGQWIPLQLCLKEDFLTVSYQSVSLKESPPEQRLLISLATKTCTCQSSFGCEQPTCKSLSIYVICSAPVQVCTSGTSGWIVLQFNNACMAGSSNSGTAIIHNRISPVWTRESTCDCSITIAQYPVLIECKGCQLWVEPGKDRIWGGEGVQWNVLP